MLRRFYFVIVASILFPACAFVDNEIQLEYQYVPGSSVSALKQGTIYLSLFEDRRIDKTKVGVIRNAYGMETAKVLTKDDPAIWVSNTLKGNLERSGYKVETVEKGFSPGKGQFYLSGNITKVYSDPKPGFWAFTVTGDVEALLQAEFKGQRTQEMIAGHKEETSIVSSGGEMHKGVLNQALADFVAKVSAWIEKLRN